MRAVAKRAKLISRFVKRVEPVAGKARLLIGYNVKGITVDSQSDFTFVDRDEDGELKAFEIETNSAQMAVEITLQGDVRSSWQLCDDTMSDLLRKGRGITPGDAEITSGERSKDPIGQRCENFVFLARFKDDQFSDYQINEERVFVARFDPVEPFPYTGITVRIKNFNTAEEEAKTIVSGQLLTYVYGDAATKQGMELHTEDLVPPENTDTESAQNIDDSDPTVADPPPPDEAQIADEGLPDDSELDEVSTPAESSVAYADYSYKPDKPAFMTKYLVDDGEDED
jgi:hypothetical protein